MIQNRLFQRVVCVLAGLMGGTSLCGAEPITYQGQLLTSGEPAAGLYDLEVKLFDALVMGEQVGDTLVFEDHPVPSGLLELELDFGEVFTSAEVFLEISVRIGESEDAFDTLAPRQRIAPAPKALHATTADSVTGSGWIDGGDNDSGGRILWHGDGGDRVLVNRMSTVSPIEFFGVHANLPAGGIVISNDDENAITILSHAPGNTIKASESFNGMTQEWTIDIDQERALTVSLSGVTAPAVTADSFQFTEPIASAVTIAGDSFYSAFGTPFRASFFGGGAYLSTPGDNAPLVAPVVLPHGATVTKMIARLEDNTSSSVSVSLTGALADGSLVSLAAVNTMGMAPVAGLQTLMTEDINAGSATINGFGVGYYLRVFSSSWPGDSSLRIWSVTIEYTIDSP